VMTDKQFDKMIEAEKGLRKLMTSSVSKRAEKPDSGK